MARPLNLADVLEVITDAVPDRPAIITNDAEYSYAVLDERATRLANHLAASGVGRGDHVGVHAPNRIEWIDAFFACFKIGAAPINVNYRYVHNELRYLYSNANCVAIIVAPEYRQAVADIEAELGQVRHILTMGDEYDAACAAASAERPPYAARSADDIYMLYTGGTTGMPKGVMWRNEDIIMAALNAGRGNRPIERVEQLGEEAAAAPMALRMMGMGPMMHGGAQWTMGNALVSGSTYVMYCGSFDAHRVWELAVRSKTNSISTMGDAMARPLAEALADGTSTYDLSNLYGFGNGGAPLTPNVKAQLRAVLPKVAIVDSYGASETGAAGARPDDGSQGAPRFNTGPDTTVLSDDLRVCAVGEIGKLARTRHIPLGYYQDPDKTAATFPVVDGKRWVVPGDFARIEDDGSISVLGRGSVSINSGGEKIFPEEVEAALKAHPAVYDAAVVGTPSERWGEQVTALVVLRPGMTADLAELVAHARTLIADYKAPKSVLVVDGVPRTPVGKVDYRACKDDAMARLHSPDGAVS